MMRRNKILAGFIVIAFGLTGCNDAPQPLQQPQSEDVVETPNHEKAIETHLSVHHLNAQRDEIVTQYTVWRNGEQKERVEHRDTVQALPAVAVRDSADLTKPAANGPNEYEFYITVK